MKKQVYKKIKGFDENLVFGEDSEVVKRATACGYKFRILKKPKKVLTSTRRFDNSNFFKIITIIAIFNLGRLLGHEFRKQGKFLKYFI